MSPALSPEALAEIALVPSDGRPGRVHTVRDALTDHPTCDCPDWLHRRLYTDGVCKHVKRVRRAIRHLEEARALLTPPEPRRGRGPRPKPAPLPMPDVDGTPW